MVFEQNIVIDDKPNYSKIIKVIGVGGAGCNAINRMIEVGIKDVDLVATNTDYDVLSRSKAKNTLQLGKNITTGLGAGFLPEVGRQAAEASSEAIDKLLETPTKMVFITAGMGGGTGTGAAPYIAAKAKEKGILTVAVVTYPFIHEGDTKISNANAGIESMKESCDAVLIINNQRIFEIFSQEDISDRLAKDKADDVLVNAVKCIAEIVTITGEVNIDFNDVNTTLVNKGQAMMGVGEAEGEDRERKALNMALGSPLLENCNIRGAKNILINYTYSIEKPEYELKVMERLRITEAIKAKIGKNAQMVKDGTVYDNTMGGRLQIKIVAAGFDEKTIIISMPKEEIEPNKPFKYLRINYQEYINQLREEYKRNIGSNQNSFVQLDDDFFKQPVFERMEIDLIDAKTTFAFPGKVYQL
jgi:cell division protein FtsZ